MTVLFIIALFKFGLPQIKADLPAQGEINLPAENFSILDFSVGKQFSVSTGELEGVVGMTVGDDAGSFSRSVNGSVFPKGLQGGSFELTNCVVAHSNSTGQVSGQCDGTVRGFATTGANSIRTGEISGKFFFTAKSLKRGSLVTLSGAKLTGYSVGSGSLVSYGDIRFNYVSRPVFTFKALEVDTSLNLDGSVEPPLPRPPRLRVALRAGQFPVSAAGYVFGKEIRRNIPVPYPGIDFDEMEVSSDNLIGLSADISYLTQNSKGIIQGVAARILSNETAQTPSTAGSYSINGSRSTRTGLSKLTFTGFGSLNGVSAILNVNDSYQIQTGRGFSNSLRAFGYYVAF